MIAKAESYPVLPRKVIRPYSCENVVPATYQPNPNNEDDFEHGQCGDEAVAEHQFRSEK